MPVAVSMRVQPTTTPEHDNQQRTAGYGPKHGQPRHGGAQHLGIGIKGHDREVGEKPRNGHQSRADNAGNDGLFTGGLTTQGKQPGGDGGQIVAGVQNAPARRGQYARAGHVAGVVGGEYLADLRMAAGNDQNRKDDIGRVQDDGAEGFGIFPPPGCRKNSAARR